jgi:hypothetical protein
MGQCFYNDEFATSEHVVERNIRVGTYRSIAVVPQQWNLTMEWLELCGSVEMVLQQ